MLNRTNIFIAIILPLLLFISCKKDKTVEDNGGFVLDMTGTSSLPSYQQRSGNADSGYHYLIYGDYVSSGIPYSAFVAAYGGASDNLLNRTGNSANVPYGYNAVDASNGIKVVSANCLTCHASKLNGEFIVGLGNSVSDFTTDQSSSIPSIDMLMNLYFPGNPSPEWVAYEPFRNAVVATGPYIIAQQAGVNTADKLAAVLAAHRNKVDLSWSNIQSLSVPNEVIPSDIPPWWILKKKNAMFYTAVGRGDFTRIMMASSILTMQDSAEARKVDNEFADVLAYINSLEAPVYTGTIQSSLADEGKLLFDQRCAPCHGSYGDNETFPNLFVDLEKIGTDSLLSVSNYAYTDFVDWYNASWFAQEPYSALLQSGKGYIAPPLDGIWATAPYFHNASVPSLEGVLNSSKRPTFWSRDFNAPQYDVENVGWVYTEESTAGDQYTYDTTIPGYGNQGHLFGDELSDFERSAIIEYLKTI